jgi:hypothetical protein
MAPGFTDPESADGTPPPVNEDSYAGKGTYF